MTDPLTRRTVLALGGAALVTLATPPGAHATTLTQARTLVDAVAAELTAIVNSGGTTAQMIDRFEGVFDRLADMPVIARSVLGPVARTASAAQLARFTSAYRGYLARKYGRTLFGGYSGGEIAVTGAATSGTVHSVQSVARMQRRSGGTERLDVVWQVSSRSPEPRFFNMIIDGVNFFAIEREEVPALLEVRRGDLDRLIADLPGLG
ncbi:MlaC/ttg2D family ABC transporter substrate-binding protein [Rhodobaculum claviforme]|nr:ABC transporter substrate-binding protein [Rhodobaculum claviforme]